MKIELEVAQEPFLIVLAAIANGMPIMQAEGTNISPFFASLMTQTSISIGKALGQRYDDEPHPCGPMWGLAVGDQVKLDGNLIPAGSTLVFKTDVYGITCGRGIAYAAGKIKYTPIYPHDFMQKYRTGPIAGEFVRLHIDGKRCNESWMYVPGDIITLGDLTSEV